MGSRSHIQQTAQNSDTSPLQNQMRSRPFAPQAETASAESQTLPDVQTQLETASQYGHHLTNFANPSAGAETQPSPSSFIQPKLTIGAPGDKYEQEADRVAAQVVSQIQASKLQPTNQAQNIQRSSNPEAEELQMSSMMQCSSDENLATPDLESAISQSRGRGQPLTDSIRQPMEQAFGNDFSGVRVHADTQADQLNRSIQARAFTTQQDIFFRQGAYNPESRSGQELLAHELTHVVQQSHNTVNRQIIQRAVGFEFEFGEWKSYKDNEEKSRLTKGEEIVGGTGYKIEGEDTYDGSVSAVEVVTKPYTTREEALSSVAEAQGKMQSMHKDGQNVGHLASKYGGKGNIFVEPNGTSGKIQASAAIALDKLENLYSIQAGGKVGSGKGLGAAVEKRLKNEDMKRKYLDGGDASPELIGLVTLVLDYIEQGSAKVTLSYPKSAFKLMARTSFNKMFSLIPEYDFFRDEGNVDKWTGLVLEIAANLGFSKKMEQQDYEVDAPEEVEVEEDRMFEWMTSMFGKKKVTKTIVKKLTLQRPVFVNKTAEELAEEPIINQVLMGMELLPEDSEKDKQSYKLKIKRIEWLKAMLAGEDLISKKNDKRFEGIGSYGDSTDVEVIPEKIEEVTEKAVSKAVDKLELDETVSEPSEPSSEPLPKKSPKEAPIFELRGMKDMFGIQQDITLDDWTEKVNQVFEVIEQANQGESFAPGGKPNIPEDVDNPEIWEKVG